MSTTHASEHEFQGTWRWPTDFESWVASLVNGSDGLVCNVCAGLSPLGDIRVDLKTPIELVENLQADSGTNLERAREYLSGLIQGHPPVDVVSSLLTSDDPTSHPAAEYLGTDGTTIRTDVLGDQLPFSDNSFQWTICDPPWLNLDPDLREHLFNEVVRITRPGGHILFNSYWTPTTDGPVTLDHLTARQDTDRWRVGTPKVSWVAIYTVHDSVHTARYLSSTLSRREFTPKPKTIDETIQAETVYELNHICGFDIEDYDLETVDPTNTEKSCPQCSYPALNPVPEHETGRAPIHDLYECPNCKFRPRLAEL